MTQRPKPPPLPRRPPPGPPIKATLPAPREYFPDYGPPPFPKAPQVPVFGGDEPRTGQTSATLTAAQAILSCFDDASPGMRLELVEIVRTFVDLSAEDRLLVIKLASRCAQR